jgi:polyisoprenoid-binding protein YceI
MLYELLQARLNQQITWDMKDDPNREHFADPYGQLSSVTLKEEGIDITITDVLRCYHFFGDWASFDDSTFTVSPEMKSDTVTSDGDLVLHSLDGQITFRVHPYSHSSRRYR